MKKRILTGAALACASLAVSVIITPAAHAQPVPGTEVPLTTGQLFRSAERCEGSAGGKYMSVAANPAAAMAGCKVLAKGGTVIDAAVAVQAALTVVEPQASGLGGGSLLTYFDKRTMKTHIFDGLAAAGQNVTASLSTPTEDEKALHGVTAFNSSVDYTARAVGVPGTLAALDQAHQRFGNTRWKKLFDDSITLAEQGFPLAPYTQYILAGQATTPLCTYPDVKAIYCDGNVPKATGATVTNPELAGLLKEVRDGGSEAFYDAKGKIAPAIVAKLTSGQFDPTADAQGPAVIPSLLTVNDFATYKSIERDPLCTKRLGQQLCTTPAPSVGGTAVTNMLAMAELNGITNHAPDTADYAHLMIEASRIAGTDARAYIADPRYDGAPPVALTSDDYNASRAALIKPDSSVHPVTPGVPANTGVPALAGAGAAHDDTSQIAIVDMYGNALSMTTTVNQNFGSRVLARGMVLNNASTNFSAAGSAINEMEPNKRPRTTIAPSIVFNEAGKVASVVGSAGGTPIPDYIAQAILGMSVYGESPAQALARPHISGQARVANCAGIEDAASDVEAGTTATNFLPALNERAAPCARAVTLRSGAGAIKVTTGGQLEGAADPRRDGAAFGR